MRATLKLLILNRCYPPETGATGRITRDLARALADKHEVTVMVGRPSGGTPNHRHRYAFLHRQREGSMTVERLGTTAFSHGRMTGRLANYLTYLVFALFRGLTLQPKPQIVIAMTDPPLACLIGFIIARVGGCRLIYNIRDLHPDMALAARIVKPGFLVSIWERLHRWAMVRSHLIIVLGEDMRDRVVAKGIDSSRIVVVRDGSEPLLPAATGNTSVTSEIRAGSSFVVVHAGNLGFGGAWDTLLEAARLLRHEGIRFVFIGDGTFRQQLESQAGDLPNVRFLPFRREDEIADVLTSGNLQVVTIRRGLGGLVVPSKLYPILMAGQPVLAVVPEGSDVARIVRQHNCGLVADPDDPRSVARAVLYARHHPDELHEMGRRARSISMTFDRRALTREFVSVVEAATIA